METVLAGILPPGDENRMNLMRLTLILPNPNPAPPGDEYGIKNMKLQPGTLYHDVLWMLWYNIHHF